MKQKHLKYLRIAVAAVMFALFFGVALGVRQLDPVLVTQFGPGLLHLTSVLFLDILGAVIVIAAVTLVFGRIYCSILCPLGIIDVQSMRRRRPVVIVGILILAAFLTPPDVVSQIALAVPACIFYELSILIFSRYKRKQRPGAESPEKASPQP